MDFCVSGVFQDLPPYVCERSNLCLDAYFEDIAVVPTLENAIV